MQSQPGCFIEEAQGQMLILERMAFLEVVAARGARMVRRITPPSASFG
jgi:hypothetical protein